MLTAKELGMNLRGLGIVRGYQGDSGETTQSQQCEIFISKVEGCVSQRAIQSNCTRGCHGKGARTCEVGKIDSGGRQREAEEL